MAVADGTEVGGNGSVAVARGEAFARGSGKAVFREVGGRLLCLDMKCRPEEYLRSFSLNYVVFISCALFNFLVFSIFFISKNI